MLRAVTFDFWKTLYQDATGREPRLRLLGEALARHNHVRTQDELEAAYRHGWRVWNRIWREEQRSIPLDRWLDEVLGTLQASLSGETLRRLKRDVEEIHLAWEKPHLVGGVADVLPAVASRYRLGLISDSGLTPGRILRQVMARDGILDCFDVLTFSDEVGAAKPAPEPFLHTLKLLGVAPEETVHVGDLPETDIAGAKAVGMKAILFLGISRREDGLDRADAAFERYDALLHTLEAVET